jgi:hypothetical protein
MGSYVLQQLGYNSLPLIVYLIGILLAAVFVRKYPFSAMLTMAGSAILFVNQIAITMLQGYLISARSESGWSPEQYTQLLVVVSVIGNIVRAIGTALLIGAIFVGRKVKAVSPVET